MDEMNRKIGTVFTKWCLLLIGFWIAATALMTPVHELTHLLQFRMSGYRVDEYCLSGYEHLKDGEAAVGWVNPVPGTQIPQKVQDAFESQANLAMVSFVLALLALVCYKIYRDFKKLLAEISSRKKRALFQPQIGFGG